MLDMLLSKKGWQCTMAEDGTDALQLCQTQSFDLIVMDYFMPNLVSGCM
jgi:CheY-like chemotaxis protein